MIYLYAGHLTDAFVQSDVQQFIRTLTPTAGSTMQGDSQPVSTI